MAGRGRDCSEVRVRGAPDVHEVATHVDRVPVGRGHDAVHRVVGRGVERRVDDAGRRVDCAEARAGDTVEGPERAPDVQARSGHAQRVDVRGGTTGEDAAHRAGHGIEGRQPGAVLSADRGVVTADEEVGTVAREREDPTVGVGREAGPDRAGADVERRKVGSGQGLRPVRRLHLREGASRVDGVADDEHSLHDAVRAPPRNGSGREHDWRRRGARHPHDADQGQRRDARDSELPQFAHRPAFPVPKVPRAPRMPQHGWRRTI